MNLPNLLTSSRFVMAAAVFWLIAIGDSKLLTVALVIFVVACITDFLDGWLARRRDEVTVFGRIADPFADKFMVTGCLLILLQRELTDHFETGLNAWVVILILAREFLVNAIRGFVESQSIAFPAVWLGKVKAVWQFCCIGLLILYISHGGTITEEGWQPRHALFPSLMQWGVWSTVAITWISAFPYIRRAKKVLT